MSMQIVDDEQRGDRLLDRIEAQLLDRVVGVRLRRIAQMADDFLPAEPPSIEEPRKLFFGLGGVFVDLQGEHGTRALKSIGRNRDVIVAEHELRTAGKPVKILLSLDGPSLHRPRMMLLLWLRQLPIKTGGQCA